MYVFLFVYGVVKWVFIVGGGDGGILCEVVWYFVDYVMQVEIDVVVVEMVKEFLFNYFVGVYDDFCLDLVIVDVMDYVCDLLMEFDVIIVDSIDFIGFGEVFFIDDFYVYVKRCFFVNGIIVI